MARVARHVAVRVAKRLRSNGKRVERSDQSQL